MSDGGAVGAGFAVESAGAVRVRVPFRRPMQTAAGLWTHRDSWILRLRDGTGREGVGEAALDFGAGERVEAELARLMREAVEQLDGGGGLPDAAGLDAGVADRALRCAIDSATLDLELQVTPWTGGPRSVPVNATIGYLELPELEAAARAAAEAGFRTIKMKVGPERDTAELVERVAAVRQAIGPGVRLRLDANGAWDVGDVTSLYATADLGIEYVEQPVAAGHPRDMAELRDLSPVPIAADEDVVSVAAARELLWARAADVFVVKPARVGGPMAAWEIERLASAEGVPVVISTLFETGVGIAAALVTAAGLASNELAHGLATADLLESDLLVHPLEIVAGRMTVPAGIELDLDALRRYAVDWIGERP